MCSSSSNRICSSEQISKVIKISTGGRSDAPSSFYSQIHGGSVLLCTQLKIKVLNKLHDAVNAYRLARYHIDKHIGGMHVFECHAIGDVINALAVPIVTETLGCNHIVYLFLLGQS